MQQHTDNKPKNAAFNLQHFNFCANVLEQMPLIYCSARAHTHTHLCITKAGGISGEEAF